LLTWALRAVLHREKPPFRVVDPIKTLRAAPQAKVGLKSHGLSPQTTIDKTRLAVDTICWLAESTRRHAADASSVRRVGRIRDLSCAAAAACASPADKPPVFPTDIPVKRFLFDRIAQTHGYADLSSLCRACAATPADKKMKMAMDSTIVADVLFSSPNLKHSSYELAARSGVFLRPEFEREVDIRDFASLPDGVCQRDRIRAAMLANGEIECCDWNHLFTTDGSSISLPNPWSGLSSAQRVRSRARP
jgi:hypothetical protein